MRADTLAKIKKAALKVFVEYGYHGATMKRIAKTAGLSYGLVYHYFPSKARIFCHLVDLALDGSLAGMQEFIDSPGTAWEKLERYSEMVIRELYEDETSLLFLIMIQAMTQGKAIPGLLNHIAAKSEEYYEKFVPLIVQAQETGEAAPGDPVALATAYFSFVQGLSGLVFQRKGWEKKITPGMLISVLRNNRKH